MTGNAPHRITPHPEKLHQWEHYAEELPIEIRQCVEEGLDVEAVTPLMEAVHRMPESEYRERMADIIAEMVLNLPMRDDYPFHEPNDIESIRVRRDPSLWQECPVDASTLRDRLAGAWYGRICGCLLGKPVEGIRTDELHTLLKKSGNWPLHRYIVSTDVPEEDYNAYRFKLWKHGYADNVPCAPNDDDTNYTVLCQRLIEQYGRNFTPEDVMNLWLRNQPKDAYCTAERVAFCNFVKGFQPPESAVVRNPYREWIGAQIRADYFGYINPGNPEAAADMAWRDACISHVKNGIYGEMWAAAMIACAAVTDDMEAVILGGLSQIPFASRLFRDVMSVVSAHRAGKTAEEVFARIHREWDEFSDHDWCHTNSNAMIVAAALLYGEGDYSRSICMAVETGFDTDCNGATVGSVVGMMKGASAIADHWKEPVRGKLRTEIFGMECVTIDELVDRTMTHLI